MKLHRYLKNGLRVIRAFAEIDEFQGAAG